MRFADLSHYFDFCALIERRWRALVERNPKTREVNRKLDAWHRQHEPVNLAQIRIERARRRARAS
jgi:hypothetical protein